MFQTIQARLLFIHVHLLLLVEVIITMMPMNLLQNDQKTASAEVPNEELLLRAYLFHYHLSKCTVTILHDAIHYDVGVFLK